MNTLNYNALRESSYEDFILEKAPVKVVQFGEGNFLRAFADYFIDISNERIGWNGKISIVQPIERGLTDLINEQEGLYTLYLRGYEKGNVINDKRVISAVRNSVNPYEDYKGFLELALNDDLEIIISNTTEAGIVYDENSKFDDCPPSSFPAKLCRFLYERFKAGKKGLIILSCELIDNNGRELNKCVRKYIKDWKLSDEFLNWVNEENTFCSTLVDRIVPGRIKDMNEFERISNENGYIDKLIDVGETFGVWYIEGDSELEEKLPFKKAGLNVHVVPDITPYKKRKVRILNGAHTGFVLGAYLAGENIVRDSMNNEIIYKFMDKMLKEEVVPILPLDKEDCYNFTDQVVDRFKNPFIDHLLLSISLNSTSKWKTRNMYSMLEYYEKYEKLPICLVTSLAFYIKFYTSNISGLDEKGLHLRRENGDEYQAIDDTDVLKFYYENRAVSTEELVERVISNEDFWGINLDKLEGLKESLIGILDTINQEGIYKAFENAVNR